MRSFYNKQAVWTDPETPILTPHGWRLALVGLAILLGLVLYQLGTIARTGHYVPVPGKPNLCLDTRTGELHLARPARTLLEEVDVAGTDTKHQRWQQALTE